VLDEESCVVVVPPLELYPFEAAVAVAVFVTLTGGLGWVGLAMGKARSSKAKVNVRMELGGGQ
jgi:hypothetical protein